MRILFLDLDALRPDHLGCYGYARNTSPNIDAVAGEGVTFTNYYCSDAPCMPSRVALMTGRFGIHTGVVGHGGTAADMRLEGPSRSFWDRLKSETLPAFLRSQGMRTVTISPFAERHSCWTFYAGFNEIHNTGKSGRESAHEVTPTVLKWIEQNAKEDNWFLHVNYWDAHTPYRVPLDYGNPFENEPLPTWVDEEILERHRSMVGPHTAREISMFDNREDPQYPRHVGEIKDMTDLRKMIDNYDCGIRFMDDHVGMLLKALEEQGVAEDLVIIISADHGENMGELGIYGEHATADHATCRIPMIIHWPGGRKGHVDNGLHYNLDLAPTISDLLDSAPVENWDGQSYRPAILDGQDCGRDELILGQCAHVCQRSARFGDWIYIRTYHDGFHLFPTEMLFNLVDDPYQQRDLSEERPDICRDATHRMLNWHDSMMMSMPYQIDPMWTVIKEGGPALARGRLKEYCDRLVDTGRGWAVDELKRRHPREFTAT